MLKCFYLLTGLFFSSTSQLLFAQHAAKIGNRMEMFVDDAMLDSLGGSARLQLHQPQPQNIALLHDAPWEGSGSGFHNIFKDGDIYRMYYKAWQHQASTDTAGVHPSYCAYAESKDGINWYKPNLGLVAFNGSRENNIVLATGMDQGLKIDAGHPAVFKDANPTAPAAAKYKAIVRGEKPLGAVVYQSADGIHWSLFQPAAVLTNGTFDSQNLAFWDPVRKHYRAYWRYYSGENKSYRFRGKRSVRTAVSTDFIHWTNEKNLQYGDLPEEDLYINQIQPYYRAPHIYIGFPARYIDRGWSPTMRQLPELEEREIRAGKSKKGGSSDGNTRFGTVLTESLLMAGRDGVHFKRWEEAFLRPGIERKGSWTYGDNFMGWQLVETQSALPGAPKELSMYVCENYWKGKGSIVRRYTMRVDGFVSVNAPMKGGSCLTKPFTFKGKDLVLNFSSSAAGDILVEILDEKGNPIPDFTATDCEPIFGDSIDRKVLWKHGKSLKKLEGKVVRLRFIMRDADLYSYQFVNK